jgi:signal transduction histidine kinase
MIKQFWESLKNGTNKIKQNPQLLFSVFVAFVILAAFVFVANRFVTIAEDAQDRLMNIRTGFLLESFVQFTPENFETEKGIESLRTKTNTIVAKNPAFRDFRLVRFTDNGPEIILSQNKILIGEIDLAHDFLYDIARTDTDESYTAEKFEDGERYFSTVRLIMKKFGGQNVPIGAIMIEQSLTEADLKISEEINQSILVFIVIVFLIMILFFRHAKIIDYTTLYKKLKDVDQLKDDFISMASHELRTPLTVIRGYAEEIKESKDLVHDLKISAERIDIAARQLDSLVGDMLDVSKIDQGRMKLDLETVNPVELISDAVSGFQTVAKQKGLNLTLIHKLKGEKITVDPNKFRQTMINLIGNAIKYTPKGDVKITAEARESRIYIRISDSGIGISADEQKNLFQKFHRVKNEETAEIRGTGLGLWITKQIVELMDGNISIESIKGVGTHFIVDFPITSED